MSTKPNVLLISTDHWPAALFGAAGHPAIQTPTLDELCRSGVRFSNAYAECPVCIPARRTLMTGTPPRAHGDRVFKDKLTMPEIPTMAQTFRDAGYQAYAVGNCTSTRNVTASVRRCDFGRGRSRPIRGFR